MKCKPAGREFCRQRTVYPVQRALGAAAVQRAPQLRGGQVWAVPVGINTWSRHVTDLFPYLDQIIHPFDSIWFPDHVQYNGHNVSEGWTMAVYALARYPDKLVGHDVLCNSFRNPAHLAKMAATAQAFSGGRVVIGIGAGWNEEEYRGYGWPFPRARAQDRAAGRGDPDYAGDVDGYRPVNFAGKHYQLENGYCEPKPDTVPPIMVGGGGERYLLRVVAEQADWWNWVCSRRGGVCAQAGRCCKSTAVRWDGTMTRFCR